MSMNWARSSVLYCFCLLFAQSENNGGTNGMNVGLERSRLGLWVGDPMPRSSCGGYCKMDNVCSGGCVCNHSKQCVMPYCPVGKCVSNQDCGNGCYCVQAKGYPSKCEPNIKRIVRTSLCGWKIKLNVAFEQNAF